MIEFIDQLARLETAFPKYAVAINLMVTSHSFNGKREPAPRSNWQAFVHTPAGCRLFSGETITEAVDKALAIVVVPPAPATEGGAQ